MHIRKLTTRGLGVFAKWANRLLWRKQLVLALLFIGTPLITGGMEVFVLNLAGLGIAALVAHRVMQARNRSQTAKVRQQALVNSISTRRTR